MKPENSHYGVGEAWHDCFYYPYRDIDDNQVSGDRRYRRHKATPAISNHAAKLTNFSRGYKTPLNFTLIINAKIINIYKKQSLSIGRRAANAAVSVSKCVALSCREDFNPQ